MIQSYQKIQLRLYTQFQTVDFKIYYVQSETLAKLNNIYCYSSLGFLHRFVFKHIIQNMQNKIDQTYIVFISLHTLSKIPVMPITIR